MFDNLLEKIQKADEIENKVLSILEGKTWEQITLLRHLSQTRFVNECVCHIYGLSDVELLEFYGSMGDGWNAFNERYGSDKTEVKAEIEKRGLVIPVNEEQDDLPAAIETLVRNELQNDPDISREELFQNVLDGVKDEVRDEAREILPDVFDDVTSHYFESVNENLTDHARRELELAGMFDKDVDGSEAMGSWNRLCAEAVLELMEVFAEQGHSGFSASMTQELFSRLAKYEKLTELTDSPDEWMDISEFQSGEPGWQSRRSPSCFSEDGGKTYWDIDEDWNRTEDEDGSVWSGSSEEEWANRPMHQSKHFEKKE